MTVDIRSIADIPIGEELPSSAGGGAGRDIKQKPRSLLNWSGRGGVVQTTTWPHHPVCAVKDAAHLLLIAQPSPPPAEEGSLAHLQFGAMLY